MLWTFGLQLFVSTYGAFRSLGRNEDTVTRAQLGIILYHTLLDRVYGDTPSAGLATCTRLQDCQWKHIAFVGSSRLDTWDAASMCFLLSESVWSPLAWRVRVEALETNSMQQYMELT